MITVEQVRTASQKRRFVALAREIYPPTSPWIRPLDIVLRDYLHPQNNPFYRDGVGQAFLAKQQGKIVGRILAHVWRRHARLHNERVGYFGFLECVDNPQVAAALLNAASEYVRSHGCETLRGPFNMTAAQEMGIVVDGFSGVPAVDMVYTPEWYPKLLESAGFVPILQMETWRNTHIQQIDPLALWTDRLRETQKKYGIVLRSLRTWGRSTDLASLRELINSAFLGNWNFVPITAEEWELQVGPLVPILDPELIQIAEVNAVPVGVTFAAPDFNGVLRNMNGSLFHPHAWRLFQRRPASQAVVILFAVRKQFQNLGISRMLNAALLSALRKRGYESLAITWIAVENQASRSQANALGMERLHTLAMYERKCSL